LAYPSRLVSHERLEISPRTAADRRLGNTIDWASIDIDLELVRRTKANLLVIGSESVVTKVVRRVIAGVTSSVVHPEAGQLPPSEVWPHSGTVVVHDVDTLDTLGQLRMSEQLAHGSASQQIISTASVPLFPLVEAGVFDGTLYYRLNTVYVRLP
jgi:hypothetical protein